MGRLTEGQRLAALALVPIIALAIFAFIVASNEWNERSQAQDIADAVEYSNVAGTLAHELQFERSLMVLRSQDTDLVTDEQLAEQYARTDAAITGYLDLVDGNYDILGAAHHEAIEHIVGDLSEDEIVRQRGAIANGTATPEGIITDYTDTSQEVIETVAIVPTLTTQADIALQLDSYLNLLEAQDRYSIVAAEFVAVFADDSASDQKLADLRALMVLAEDDLANFEANAQSDVLRQYAQINTMDAFANVEQARQTAFESGSDGNYGVDPSAWHDAAMEHVGALFSVQQTQETALLDDADAISADASSAVAWALIGAVVAILLATGLAVLVSRSFLDPLRHLTGVSEEIQAGNLGARASVNDEHAIGRAAEALNLALDEVTSLVQTREERDRIQQQIITLLDEVSAVAEGDLTVEAEVTADALGSVADSFNYMISELRGIVASVNQTTAEVTAASGDIARSSTTLAESSEMQARQVADAAMRIEEMAASISKVSETAGLGASVASDARANAQRGAESVRATIEGMQRIRSEVQGTSRTIKRLGESSQEIGSIVALIEEIANQTNLLALNAAIQAAMAGEHGRGFAVVAEEVRRLAERAGEATQQIGNLVTSIQQETSEAVVSMDNSTREVVEGSRLADEAGATLAEIDAVVSRMAELIEEISVSSTQQADTAGQIAMTMKEVSEGTRTTTASTREAAESVNRLAGLAERLRESVATFRIGEDSAPAVAPSPADGD